jgi:hypothetical protein
VWAVLSAASLVAVVLVKGVLGLLGPVVCGLWLLARRDAAGSNEVRITGEDRRAWWGLAAAVVAMGLTIVAYEMLYRRATGQAFLSDYLTRQLGLAAAPHSGALLAQKARNLVWYLGRLLWFPFPWSLALLVAAFHRGTGDRAANEDPGVLSAARSGLGFALGVAGLYLLVFSLSDRRADRYIFPAYYALGAAGALVALRTWGGLRRAAERVDRHPAAPAALFFLLFALHVTAGRLGLPTLKLWAPD